MTYRVLISAAIGAALFAVIRVHVERRSSKAGILPLIPVLFLLSTFFAAFEGGLPLAKAAAAKTLQSVPAYALFVFTAMLLAERVPGSLGRIRRMQLVLIAFAAWGGAILLAIAADIVSVASKVWE